MANAEDLADAYEAVAQANHYLVGILARDNITADDYDAAEQVLITRENNETARVGTKWSRRKWRIGLALDVLAYDRKRIFDRY